MKGYSDSDFVSLNLDASYLFIHYYLQSSDITFYLR